MHNAILLGYCIARKQSETVARKQVETIYKTGEHTADSTKLYNNELTICQLVEAK